MTTGLGRRASNATLAAVQTGVATLEGSAVRTAAAAGTAGARGARLRVVRGEWRHCGQVGRRWEMIEDGGDRQRRSIDRR